MYQKQYSQGQAQNVGLNYLGVDGGGGMGLGLSIRWDRLGFEPFVTREEGRYPSPGTDPVTGQPIPGSPWLGVRKMAKTAVLESCFSFILVFVTVGSIAGAFASTSNGVLRALIVAGSYATCRWAGVAARYTPHLPRAGDPGLVWYWWCRGEIGAVILIIYQIAQYGGASLAMLALCVPNLFISDMWRGIGKFGAGAALNDFGAWAHYFSAAVILYCVFGLAQTFTTKRYSYAKRYVHAATLQAATAFGLGLYLYQVGIMSCANPLVFYAGAVGGGTQYMPTGDAMSWVIPILLGPIAAGPVAALIVWLLWDVNELSKEEKLRGYNLDVLDGETVQTYKDSNGDTRVVPGPRPGGAQHTAAGRREDHPPAVSSDINPLGWLFQQEHDKLQ